METIYEIRKKMANGGDTIFEADKIIGNTNKSTDYEVLKTIANGGTKYECTVNKAKSLGITSDLPNRYEADKAIYNKLNANYTILVNHNNFGTIQFEVDGVVSTGNTITVRGGKTLKMTLVPDSTKQANYGEWQSASETTESTDLTKTIVVNENKTYLAWFGMESFDYTSATTAIYDNLPFDIPIRRVLYNRTITGGKYASFALPFNLNTDTGANAKYTGLLHSISKTNSYWYYNESTQRKMVTQIVNITKVNAGEAFLLYSPTTFVMDNFEFVTMTKSGNGHMVTTPSGTNRYPIDFIGVIEGNIILPAGNDSNRYISNNTWYYPNSKSNVTMTPNRCYIKLLNE